jgi:hypothetical protein
MILQYGISRLIGSNLQRLEPILGIEMDADSHKKEKNITLISCLCEC